MEKKIGAELKSGKEHKPTRTPQPLVAHPVREAEPPKDATRFRSAMSSIASAFPSLKNELMQAEMRYTPAGFVYTAVFSALFLTIALLALSYLVLRSGTGYALTLALLAPVLYALSFFYFMLFPKVKAKKRAREIDAELVFAGRHMLIELQSGVPLYDAMLGVSREYGVVSEEFNKVVEKVTLGVPLGVALHSVAEGNPSQYFNRLVMQMANSLASGSDVTTALEASLEQISREQIIELKAYGQKLNPIAMFFMIFAIIMPSLGVAFAIVVVSFLGSSAFALPPIALLGILMAIGLVQFLFLTVIESSRPKFDMGI